MVLKLIQNRRNHRTSSIDCRLSDGQCAQRTCANKPHFIPIRRYDQMNTRPIRIVTSNNHYNDNNKPGVSSYLQQRRSPSYATNSFRRKPVTRFSFTKTGSNVENTDEPTFTQSRGGIYRQIRRTDNRNGAAIRSTSNRYSLDETMSTAYCQAGSAADKCSQQLQRLGSLRNSIRLNDYSKDNKRPQYPFCDLNYCNTRLEFLSVSGHQSNGQILDGNPKLNKGFANGIAVTSQSRQISRQPSINSAKGSYIEDLKAGRLRSHNNNLGMCEPKKVDSPLQPSSDEQSQSAVVKATDMDNEQILQTTKMVASIIAQHQKHLPLQGYMLMAREIKLQHDRLFGGFWHCIVGQHFAAFVTHDSTTFAYINYGQLSILLFKSM